MASPTSRTTPKTIGNRAPKPAFFATQAAFRSRLERHHAVAAELLVGFWRRDARSARKSRTCSYERREAAALDPGMAKTFKADRKAWAFFQELASSYRNKVVHWIVSAKGEATRSGRLQRLMAACAAGRKL